MLKTILVPVDASDQKDAVLHQAVEITRNFGGTLHLVAVHDINQLWEAKMPEPPPEIFDSLEEETRARLEAAQKQVQEWGMASEGHFLEGPVTEQISLLAGQINADLIVMGHRQMSKLRRLLKNSAAKGLIDESPCSVMIVREHKGATEEGQ